MSFMSSFLLYGLHVLFILNGFWDDRQVAVQLLFFFWSGGCFRICARQCTVFLCSSHLVISQCILLLFMWCIHIVVWTLLQLERNSILLDQSDFHMIDSLSIAFHTFTRHMLILLSGNEIQSKMQDIHHSMLWSWHYFWLMRFNHKCMILTIPCYDDN